MNKNTVHISDIFIADDCMAYKDLIFTGLIIFFIIFFICYGVISFIFDFINLFS